MKHTLQHMTIFGRPCQYSPAKGHTSLLPSSPPPLTAMWCVWVPLTPLMTTLLLSLGPLRVLTTPTWSYLPSTSSWHSQHPCTHSKTHFTCSSGHGGNCLIFPLRVHDVFSDGAEDPTTLATALRQTELVGMFTVRVGPHPAVQQTTQTP